MRYALLAVMAAVGGCNTAWHIGGPINEPAALTLQKGITTKNEVIGKLGVPDMVKGDVVNGNGVFLYFDIYVGSTFNVGCPIYYPSAYAPYDQLLGLDGYIPYNRRCYQVQDSDKGSRKMFVTFKDGTLDDIQITGGPYRVTKKEEPKPSPAREPNSAGG